MNVDCRYGVFEIVSTIDNKKNSLDKWGSIWIGKRR